MFLAHFTGGGIDTILDMDTDDFFTYLDAAIQLYELEMKAPKRVILSGIEKQ